MRVVLADDARVVQLGMGSVVKALGHEVVDVVDHVEDVLQSVITHRPDLALLDLYWEKHGAKTAAQTMEAVRAIRAAVPETRPVIMTAYTDADESVDVLEAGAKGIISKNMTRDELQDAFDKLQHGHTVIDKDVQSRMLARMHAPVQAPPAADASPTPHPSPAPFAGLGPQWKSGAVEPLTARQTEMVALWVSGMSQPQIAERLGVSPSTVKTHIDAANRRLGIASRNALFVWARDRGLLSFYS
jgi:DNA-binding NarL/FixJ family response regulator